MPQSKADEHNPLLSTPIATIAVDLFKAELARDQEGEARPVATACVDSAEEIVQALRLRGHLPPELIETDEATADDATLILQGLMLGVVQWIAYAPGDPRLTLIVGNTGQDYGRMETKLVKGVPKIDDNVRADIQRLIAPLLRRL